MKYFYDTEFHEDGKTIDLISIGIVAEDGREYYAVNADANWFRIHTHEWLKANVVPNLSEDTDVWKPKAQIRDEVGDFLLHGSDPELWAWFSAYDHVVLAQLFGTMVNLPKGIPMYTHDLRAYIDYQRNNDLPVQAEGHHNALADARWVKEAYEYAATEAFIATAQADPEGRRLARAAVALAQGAKLRTVTTMEELDALPMGSVVLSLSAEHYSGDFPISYQRWADNEWHRPGRSADTHPHTILPAVVLHEQTRECCTAAGTTCSTCASYASEDGEPS